MVRRVIAAWLLFVVAAWAELLLAPMLVMHTPPVPGGQALTQTMAGHHHAMPSPHPCCPQVQSVPIAAPMIELAASSLPCGDQHRCCFRPGPQSSPAVARDDHKPSHDIELLPATKTTSPSPAFSRSIRPEAFAQSAASTFGVILRI